MTQFVTEAEFQQAVVELARAECGWKVYHTYDSRRSAPGFPDLVLARQGVLLFWELKAAKGRATAAQREWLDALRATGANVDVLYPEDWPAIEIDLR